MATWNIVNTIDQGGFGKVHEVESNGQKGALKELKNYNQTNLKRFQTEINILQKYNHNNIIEIFGSNINGNPPIGPFYVMEYMAGGSLKAMMDEAFKQNKFFLPKWTLQYVIFPVIEAILYAHNHHSHPSYHRDLKPANLLFTDQNQTHIKVADWGIGKDINRTSIALTVGGIGTPGYCAPEQWFAVNAIDGRADIYSLGIIFYQMLTGILPQVYNNSGQQFSIAKPSSKQTAAQPLDNVILKMIAFEPSDRYQTIQEVKNVLTPISWIL